MAAKPMTEEHKAALAEGRKASHAVRAYMDALAANRPKRGRKRTVETIDQRITAIDEALGDASSLERVSLIQERLDLTDERKSLENPFDISELEAGFVQHAKDYSTRKGITYTAWREAGVPAAVLKAAGISR